MLWLSHFVENTTQRCWGCEMFDRLFGVVSSAAAALYGYMTILAIVLLAVFVAFYILYSVWKNLSDGAKDFTYRKYLKPVVINSLVVFAMLSTGAFFPRLVTRLTIEPVSQITLLYSEAMLNKTAGQVDMLVEYEPAPMEDDGFYRPELRDAVIRLIKTSTTQFQAMMTMGLHIMDGAFSWSALTGIGALAKHALMFFIGLALTWGFFKLFVRFCFYFVDVIINLSMFAFFFPLGLAFFVFRNSESAGWVKQLGQSIAPGMLKNVINSIVTLATVTITYIIIMVLISRFFAGDAVDGEALATAVLNGDIFKGDISSDNIVAMTLSGVIVLIYVVQFLSDRIGKVTEMITKTFGVDPAKPDAGDALGGDLLKMGEDTLKFVGAQGKILVDAIRKP